MSTAGDNRTTPARGHAGARRRRPSNQSEPAGGEESANKLKAQPSGAKVQRNLSTQSEQPKSGQTKIGGSPRRSNSGEPKASTLKRSSSTDLSGVKLREKPPAGPRKPRATSPSGRSTSSTGSDKSVPQRPRRRNEGDKPRPRSSRAPTPDVVPGQGNRRTPRRSTSGGRPLSTCLEEPDQNITSEPTVPARPAQSYRYSSEKLPEGLLDPESESAEKPLALNGRILNETSETGMSRKNVKFEEKTLDASKHAGAGAIDWSYKPIALCCLGQKTWPRSWALALIKNPWFDRLTMLVIFINCLTLAMYRPCTVVETCGLRCAVLAYMDYFIFAYFLTEMLIKMLAMGIFGGEGYLSDSWNRLDFFIVMAGSAEYAIKKLVGDLNLTAIRTIRVLRPLRAVKRIPSLRILVTILLDTLPMLGNVLLLCFFVFFVFGIVGLQLWKGVLRQRCVPGIVFENYSFFPDPQYYEPDFPEDTEWLCSKPSDSGGHTCDNLPPTLNDDGVPCNGSYYDAPESIAVLGDCYNYNQYYNVCGTTDDNPFGGAISFDNILYSFLSVFVAISMDGWVDIMYATQDAHSQFNFIYFVLLVVIGSFYMVNLFLAVIATQFGATKKAETAKMAAERAADAKKAKEKGVKRWIKEGKHKLRKISIRPQIADNSKNIELEQIDKKDQAKNGDFTDKQDKKTLVDGSMREYFNDVISSYTAMARGNALSDPPSKACGEMLALSGARIGTMALTLQIKAPALQVKTTGLSTLKFNSNLSPSAKLNLEKAQKRLEERMITNPGMDLMAEMYEQFAFVQEAQEAPPRGCLGRCQDSLQKFVDGPFFSRSIMLAIILNTISMAAEHHNQPDWLTEVLDYTNYFFTGLFAFEMTMKNLAYGPKGYLKDPMNVFDGTIVIVSVIELCQGGGGSLSVLRTFRLLRVFKLVRFIPSLRYQLVIMVKCFKNVTVFLVLLVLFIFIFTLLGMVVFGGKFCRNAEDNEWCSCDDINNSTITCECERDNFDDLLHAAITVFMVLTGTYGDMLFLAMERMGGAAAVYFVLLLTFGNYVLLNLLVGILLEGFEETDEAATLEQLDEEMGIHHRQTKMPNVVCSHRIYPIYEIDPGPYTDPDKATTVAIGTQLAEKSRLNNGASIAGNQSDADVPHSWNNKQVWKEFLESSSAPKHSESYDANYSVPILRQERPPDNQVVWNNKWVWQQYLEQETGYPKPPTYCPYHGTSTVYPPPMYTFLEEDEGCCNCMEFLYAKTPLGRVRDYTFFLCSTKCFLRKICRWLVSQWWFDTVILFFIAVNCLTFAMERPAITDDSFERKFLTVSNYVFTGIFTVEMIIKVIAFGFICGPNAYLKGAWNKLDGTLVFVSWVSIIFDFYLDAVGSTEEPPAIFGIIRVLRLLRALRPLRVINRAPGLKIVVSTLISSMKPIGSVMLISAMFFLIFAILGVQLYAGCLYYCDGEDTGDVVNKTDCLDRGYSWVNQNYNFDNLGNALILLFVLSTLDNWNELLYQGMDIVGEDQEPKENAAEYNVIYYVVFVMIVGFFILNMFVGVVVENFQQNSEQVAKQKAAEREKRKQEKQQKRFAKKVEKTRWQKCCSTSVDSDEEDLDDKKVRVRPPFWTYYGPRRLCLYKLVSHKYFDLLIAGIIILNVLTMSVEFYNQPYELTFTLEIFNYVFTAIFTLEAALKIGALGVKRYFSDGWNRFDMIVVILSFLGIILEQMETLSLPINPTIIRVMRILRITRILKLLKMAKGIQSLMDCVAQALPQVGNLAILFILMFYIFAALGVELFGKIECSEDSTCEGMGEHVNFKNFPLAFLTLFRVATGDNWNSIMLDTMKPECCNEYSTNCTENCCPEYQPKPLGNCCDSSSGCNTNCCVTQGVGPLYFFLFVLLSAFVLMNLVVAVLLKYLEEQNEKPDDVSSPDIAVNLAARGIKQEMIQRKDSQMENSTEVVNTQMETK